MAHKNKENRSPWKERQSRGKPRTLRGRHKRPTESFSFAEADDRIYDIFRHHGFRDFPHAQRQQLTQFYFVLMENQRVHNFTRLLKLRDIAIKHFIDSLIVAEITKIPFPLLDLGTGPGFPGIPLKISHPDEKILLAEGVQSRVNFLKTAREKLELKGLEIIGRNINEDFAYPVNSVITRAVEDIGNTLRKVFQCLPIGGRVLFMKGPNVGPEISEAEKKWSKVYKLAEHTPYELPNTPHQRRLVVFEKISRDL